MEKILFQLDDSETVEFYVLEQTRIAGKNYILVTDSKDEDGEALILKDTSQDGEEESVYVIVEEDEELNSVAQIFGNLLEDVTFVQEKE